MFSVLDYSIVRISTLGPQKPLISYEISGFLRLFTNLQQEQITLLHHEFPVVLFLPQLTRPSIGQKVGHSLHKTGILSTGEQAAAEQNFVWEKQGRRSYA
jgi:hypothetical protein